MKVFLGYATTEGHTRKILRFAADHLVDHGHSVELSPLAEAEDVDLARFHAVILAASVHVNHYQRELADFVKAQGAGLAGQDSLFLSVSLAAAGHDAEEWRGLDRIAADMAEATGWSPGRVVHVAGAYAPSRYDVFRRFAMKRIIKAKDPEADPDVDKEYTDWDGLAATLDDWLAD